MRKRTEGGYMHHQREVLGTHFSHKRNKKGLLARFRTHFGQNHNQTHFNQHSDKNAFSISELANETKDE